MISAKNIFYSYGKENIFEGANFFVAKNSKVGVVGANGSGKSTLFNLITGQDFIDDGSLEIIGDVMSVPQEVKQDPLMEKAESIRDYLDPYYEKQDYELLKMLSKLELSRLSLDGKPQILSGGQKTKLAIVRALIFEPDILLLDEPTNFLDIEGKKWMMNFLGRYSKTLIIVSHDLKLLDKNIDKILEINKHSKQIEEYNGNYSNYVKLKGERDTLLVNQIHIQERKIVEMKKGLVKIAGNRSEKGVRQKLNLQKRIEKLVVALPEMPPAIKKISMQLPEPSWVGEVPFIVKNLCKSYGDKKVLTDINFDIKRGERIALIGQNGAGKSTLIKILMGMLTPDSGEIIKDEKIKIGYYSQEFETFDMNKNLLKDYISRFKSKTLDKRVNQLFTTYGL